MHLGIKDIMMPRVVSRDYILAMPTSTTRGQEWHTVL